jgi:hypothetical protein
MRENDTAGELLSKAFGHLQTCSDPGSKKLYQEIAEVFGASSIPPVGGWKPSGVIRLGVSGAAYCTCENSNFFVSDLGLTCWSCKKPRH